MNPTDQKVADTDIADLLAQSLFAGQFRTGAPVLVVANEPPRIIFANNAAHAVFRTESLEQINAVAMSGTSSGARRLRRLAGALTVGAPARLELLRFHLGRLPMQLTLLCGRVAGSHGEAFLIATQPPGGARKEAETAQEAQNQGAPTSQPSAPPPSGFSRGQVGGKDGAPQRFLWSANERSCFDAPAKAFAEAVGEAAPRRGESLEAVKARTGIDTSGELANALASRTTFSLLRLAWPCDSLGDSERKAVIVALSGAPIFDRERRFLGYRGFGIVTGETARFDEKSPGRADLGDVGQSERSRAETSDREKVAGIAAIGTNDLSPAAIAAAPMSSPRANDAATAETPLLAQDSPSELQTSSGRSAEIVPLRLPSQSFSASPNVVPIRPGPLRQLPASDEGARRSEDDEGVELTTHERDAFREIARALGAKVREQRDDGSDPNGPQELVAPAQGQFRDLIDVGAPEGDAGTPTAGPDGRDASEALDRLPIGALIARGGEALYLNRTLLDLLGYRDLAQFRTSGGLPRIFGGRDPEQVAPPGEGGALSLMSADGEAIAVDGQIQTIKWDGAPATLISLRRSLEAEYAARLRALEFDARNREGEARELSAVLDTATDGVVMLDARGRILSLNRPGEALFGFDQKEVAGQDFRILFSPESQEPVQAYFDGLQTSGLASLLNDGREALGRERHGRAIPLFITLGFINSSPDAKFCAVLRDMTQWKTIERDLEAARGQAEKASALKSEFLAKISHEIRTPLNAILGFAEVIMDERFGPIGNDRYKEYLKDIHSSGAHVMSLVNDLLDLSKIEAGKLELTFTAVDANSIIQECVSLMQPQAAQERIIMRLSLFDKLPRIVADERSLRQIMLNLMSNAVKFNEPGGQVIVSTAMNDSGQAVIRVRDTGIGMSDAELGTALEPFQRISTARQTGGTGLGLPLTKALVEANRAGFSIKSRKEQGTLVEVAFPTTQTAAAQ
jgi:PAS domain S-box-containing protein